MPLVTFIQLGYLWLLLLLVPLWAVALIDPRRTVALRRWLSLGLRTIILVALVLAIAGVQIVQRSSSLTTVFVIDNSDSVAPAMRARADQYVQAALEQMPPNDQAAIVVFGKDAVVERAPSGDQRFVRTMVAPSSDQTDIHGALQLALAMLSPETRNRIVLLSDGAETQGQALDAAELAQAAGVPIDTVSLISPPSENDVAIEVMEAPAHAREGQQVRIVVQARSSRETTAELTVLRDRQPVAQREVQLSAGINRSEVSVPAIEPGFHAWEARIRAPGDTVAANDVQFGFTEVRGRPHVLIATGESDAAQYLQEALQAAQLDVTVVAPQGLPTTLSGFDPYDAVALVNVPLRSLPDRTVDVLPTYVHELGRGLLMVGGDQSFGAGGYRDTPIEAALPVDMDVPINFQRPPVSVVIVIDISGSMSDTENGVQKIKLAAEGAARVAAQLRDEDEITVIPFDSAPVGMIGPLPGTQRAEALERIGGISIGGGGIEITNALNAAATVVRQSEKPVRHIITLTDGNDTVQQEGSPALVEALRSEGVTLSSIAIGRGKDVPFLERIVEIGDGRFFLTDRASAVPSIMTEETKAVLESYIVEQTFVPVQTFPHSALRNIPSVPPLHGYIATTPKDTAQVILQSDRGDAVLAEWQYGLGRAAAWTPDLTGRWAKDWVGWEGFGRFAAQLVGGLLPAPSLEGFEAHTSVEGTALALDLRADAADGRPRSGLQATGRVLQSDGSVIEIPLAEVGPGRYRGTTTLPEAGVYRVQTVVQDSNGSPLGVISTGAVVLPSAEYVQRDGNMALLQALAQQTGGRHAVEVEQVWEAPATVSRRAQPLTWPLLWMAVLLWPIDIAVRRMKVLRPIAAALRQVDVRRRTVSSTARTSISTAVDLKGARAAARNRARSTDQPSIGTASKVNQPNVEAQRTIDQRSQGTPANQPPSSSATTTELANWRRARRGIVERPGKQD